MNNETSIPLMGGQRGATKLSILICSVQKRLTKFNLLAKHLERQALDKPVEVVWLGDNKTMSVGEKRNKLLNISKGDYVAFVDDDDWVADDYVDEILKGIEQKKDCICFNAIYTAEAPLTPPEREILVKPENPPSECNSGAVLVEYSLSNILNVDEPGKPRLRVPNHLIPMKREFALATMFLDKNFGEDTDYGLRVRRLLKTEYRIEKPLYYYRFSFTESETHKYSPKYRRPASNPMIVMDVVMVSDATAPSSPEGGILVGEMNPPSEGREAELIDMTQAAINSIAAENVNVIVLEKDKHTKYAHADTFLQREPFNYNQCLNDGAGMGNAEFICFTNNDVLFPKGFVENVINEMNTASLNPSECEASPPSEGGTTINKESLPSGGEGWAVLSVKNQHDYIHPDIISGFCFVMRRSAWAAIGGLNTNYRFWCADNVTSEQIRQHGLKEKRSDIKVFHGTSVTLNKLDAATREEYTRTCVRQFNHDYDKNVLGMGK